MNGRIGTNGTLCKLAVALFFLFLLSVLLLSSCGGGKPESTTVPETVPATEPATDPVTDPVTDPATEPTTEPEGPVYEVRWAINGDLIRSTAVAGTVPVPPDQAVEDVVTPSQIFHFKGWDREITPVAEDKEKYIAQYEIEDRYYTATLIIDGVTSTQTVKYGDEPTVEAPEGKCVLFAEDSVRVLGDCTLRGGVFDDGDGIEELRWALAQTPIGYLPSDNQDLKGGGLASGMGLFYLLYLVRNGDGNPLLLARINDHIEHILSGGYEPRFGCCCYWTYGTNTIDFALIRNTPIIWDNLSADRKARADLLMTCHAVASAFGTDDENNYQTGPDYTGNFSKGWNPNYRLANVIPIVAAVGYFGSADAVDALLTGFDFDSVYAKFAEYGWTRASAAWGYPSHTLANGTVTRSAKELLMDGGNAVSLSGTAMGYGHGARTTYTYLKHPLADLAAIVDALLSDNYAGGFAKSQVTSGGKVVGKILDGTKTPVEGKLGMLKEFNSTDGSGTRSSLSYTTYDYVLAEVLLAGLKELNLYDVTENATLSGMVTVGNIDYLYKAVHGYGTSGTGGGTTVPWGNGARIAARLRQLGATGENLETTPD